MKTWISQIPMRRLWAWKQLRRQFRHYGDIPADFEAAVLKLESDLRYFFSGLIGDSVKQRFSIPDSYRDFLTLTGGGWREINDYGLYLFSTDGAANSTIQSFNLFAHDLASPTLWLDIGHWGDKHDICLCCDLQAPEYGTVIDAHDDHPLNNGGACRIIVPDFLRYLQGL